VIVTVSHIWSNAFSKDLLPASFHAIFVIVLRYVVKSSKEQLKQIQRPSILFIGNFI